MLEAVNLLISEYKELIEKVRALSRKYKHTLWQEELTGFTLNPITFGLKAAGWYEELKRGLDRLNRSKEIIGFGKNFGSGRNYAHIDPAVESFICRKLGLKAEPVSTQIIPRDRHAEYISNLAVIASGIERIATEIRHLQRTEIGEVEEPFTKGRKGQAPCRIKGIRLYAKTYAGSQDLSGVFRKRS